MKDLYKWGGEKTCEFVFNDDWIAMEWTIYIDGKIIKTETKINFWENIILWNTLVKDDYTYTRDNTNTQAWKISNEDDSIEDEDSYIEEENNDNLENMEIIFKCKEGVSNKNVFELPTDLEFKEFNDMAGIDYLDDLEY